MQESNRITENQSPTDVKRDVDPFHPWSFLSSCIVYVPSIPHSDHALPKAATFPGREKTICTAQAADQSQASMAAPGWFQVKKKSIFIQATKSFDGY
jgi:hypothetical protein